MDPKLRARLIEILRKSKLPQDGGGGPRNTYYERGKRVVIEWRTQHPRASYEDCIRTLTDYLQV